MSSVLIMTASTGQGHNQVARVLENELVGKGYQVEVLDIFSQDNPFLRLLITDTYNRMAASSFHLNGIIYRASNREKVNQGLNRLIYRMLKKPVCTAVASARPDLIIATHPLLVKVLGELKLRGFFNKPLVSVVTDFDVHRFYVHPQIDAYITACEETADIMQHLGIPRSKIFVNGIPIRRDFQEKSASAEDQNDFTVLLMGGSMGVKAMKKVLRLLLRTPFPIRLVVVCGNNHRLRRRLMQRHRTHIPAHIKLEILGFTHNIPELMDQADVLFSKPGGITTSEAISKGIPLAIPFLIPGVEEDNCRILEDAGLAIKINRLSEIPALVSRFQDDPSLLQQISEKMQYLARTYSIDNTLTLFQDLISRYDASLAKPKINLN